MLTRAKAGALRDGITYAMDIPPWSTMVTRAPTKPFHKPDPLLNSKIALWSGDMTKLKIGAIVNAANNRCLGGGGIDGAIHRAAGKDLYKECVTLNGCPTGDAKITKGYNLPAKHVIHTAGPVGENPKKLESCYRRCMEVAMENSVRDLCFCCVSTGIFGYPQDKACIVALSTVRRFLEAHGSAFDLVVFCTFLPTDKEIYLEKLPLYFPPEGAEAPEASASPSASPSASSPAGSTSPPASPSASPSADLPASPPASPPAGSASPPASPPAGSASPPASPHASRPGRSTSRSASPPARPTVPTAVTAAANEDSE